MEVAERKRKGIERSYENLAGVAFWHRVDAKLGNPWEAGKLARLLEAAIETDSDLHRKPHEIKVNWDFAGLKAEIRKALSRREELSEEELRQEVEAILKPLQDAYSEIDGAD